MADREVKHGRDTSWPHPSQAKDFNTTRRSCDRQKSETKVETFHKYPNYQKKVNFHQIACSSYPDWSFVETFSNCRCKDSPDRIKVKAEFFFSSPSRLFLDFLLLGRLTLRFSLGLGFEHFLGTNNPRFLWQSISDRSKAEHKYKSGEI